MTATATIACAAAHELATRAAVSVHRAGGSAVDSVIAAHAVIGVTMPNAAGLGGDLMALIGGPAELPRAIVGAGKSARLPHRPGTMGSQVTVPGLASGWALMHERWGRLNRAAILADAIRIARGGYVVDADLHGHVEAHRARLIEGGAGEWPLLTLNAGDTWVQPELADLLDSLARDGFDSMYHGPIAQAMVDAASRLGSTLDSTDFADHTATIADPVATDWRGGRLVVQPPPAQGILLSMSSQWVERNEATITAQRDRLDHVLVEATEASFQHRDDVIAQHLELLALELEVNRESAAHRGGPRAYLHTAGAAVATEDTVVSSLISVSSDFGSAVFVPELGVVLNNRADSFTGGANEYRPDAYPVHTLAPCMVVSADGSMLALATPGADGQVQTLLQVVSRMRFDRATIDDAIRAPRWRGENGKLLIESTHPAIDDLRSRGHDLVELPSGHPIFGAMVAAGISPDGLVVGADSRRSVSGVLA